MEFQLKFRNREARVLAASSALLLLLGLARPIAAQPAPEEVPQTPEATPEAPVEEPDAPEAAPEVPVEAPAAPEVAPAAAEAATEPESAPAERPTPIGAAPEGAQEASRATTTAPARSVAVNEPQTLSQMRLAGPLPPSPTREVRVHIGGGTISADDSGLRQVGLEDEMVGVFNVGASYRDPTGWLLGLQSFSSDASATSSGVDATLQLRGADLLFRYDYELFGRLRPYARVAGGARHGRVELDTAGFTLEDTAWAASVEGAAGLEVSLPLNRVRLAVYNDYGYAWWSSMSFDEASSGSARPVDLGSLDVRGFAWRLGVSFAVILGE